MFPFVNRGSAIAAVFAFILLASVGAALRAIEADANDEPRTGPVRRLTGLPGELPGWKGNDLAMTEEIIRATDTDAYLSRAYRSEGGRGTISLYVGCGVRARDLVPHRPAVCYPGAGWSLLNERAVAISAGGGRTVECKIYRFDRGGLDDRRITVLNYYIIDGQSYPDVEYLRARAWGRGRVGHVAQVQIASTEAVETTADVLVCGFAEVAAEPIERLVHDAALAVRR